VAKISVLMNVFNAMEYLPYALKSIYDIADEIIVYDGLIKQFNKDGSVKSDNGSSIDGTVEFITNYPDDDRKIVFSSSMWDWEKDKRQAMVNQASGDWMMTVDSDEVYKAKDLAYVIDVIDKNPQLKSIWLTHYRFCGDFNNFYKWPGAVWQKMYPNAKLYGLREMLYEGNKVYKWPYAGCRNVNDSEFKKHLWLPSEKEIVCYHYSNVCSLEKAHRKKLISVGLGHKMNVWDQEQFGVGMSQQDFMRLRHLYEFNGEHPEVMQEHPYIKNPPEWMKEVKK